MDRHDKPCRALLRLFKAIPGPNLVEIIMNTRLYSPEEYNSVLTIADTAEKVLRIYNVSMIYDKKVSKYKGHMPTK